MEWSILALVYLAIGLCVFGWYIHGETIDSDLKMHSSAKVPILFPELWLFWPVVLFIIIKRRRSSQHANNHFD